MSNAEFRRLDYWNDASLFRVAPKDGTDLQPSEAMGLDYEDKRAGDFSLTYKARANETSWLGFIVTPFSLHGILTEEWSLHFWFKADVSVIPPSWTMQFLDAKGSKAVISFSYPDPGWEELVIPLSGLRMEPDFELGQLCACQISIEWRDGDQVWLDDVYFYHPDSGREIGVSEKRTEQRMMEERATRGLRVEEAFRKGMASDFTGRDRQLFDQLWIGQRLDDANRELCVRWKEEKEKLIARGEIIWSSLVGETRLVSFYFAFGSKSGYMPGKLSPEAERALLELLWEHSKYTNDIAFTRHSTWWLSSSENHDLNHKVFCLLTSQIFMNEPAYCTRVYPNLGKGYGFQFGLHELATPRGEWADGESYTAGDHYAAWVTFFKLYIAERAKKGFFVERASEIYMKHSLSSIYALYNFAQHTELRHLVRKLLDLVWADWAVEQIAGIRGGPKTRHHHRVGGRDSMNVIAMFHMGGPGLTEFNYAQMLLSDYEFPPIVWELALDREGLGCFELVSRGVGEEQLLCPRPEGTERMMLCDTESRFVKISWVTPDYILGTQMDHPYAVHSQASITGRWQGMICGSSPGTRLVPVALNPSPRQSVKGEPYSMELLCNSVQHRQVLITQQRRRWMQAHPALFPSRDDYHDREIGLYFGAEWDRMEETRGWIFAQKGNAYAAVRILLCHMDPNPVAWALGTDKYKGIVVLNEDSYTWNEDQTIVRLKHKFSPILIEAGRKADFTTFSDFQQAILRNRLELYPTVVTQETGFLIVYQGAGSETKEIFFNAANTDDIPRIGGERVDYAYPYTFDSPYMQSDYNSGVIRIRKDFITLELDFNKGDQA